MSSKPLLKDGKKHVVIIGAGAAGMVPLYSPFPNLLANFP